MCSGLPVQLGDDLRVTRLCGLPAFLRSACASPLEASSTRSALPASTSRPLPISEQQPGERTQVFREEVAHFGIAGDDALAHLQVALPGSELLFVAKEGVEAVENGGVERGTTVGCKKYTMLATAGPRPLIGGTASRLISVSTCSSRVALKQVCRKAPKRCLLVSFS